MEKTRWEVNQINHTAENLKMSIILEKLENAADLNSQTDGNVNHFEKIGKCCV